MFNLDVAITTWRKEMAAAGIQSREVLDELESHLRDEIEQRVRAGADEQNAFRAVAANFGDAARLRTEFGKLQTPNLASSNFLKWFYFGSILFMLLVNTWTLLAYDLSVLEKVLGIAAVSLIALYLIKLPYLLRTLRPAPYLRLAGWIKSAANLIWLWTAYALLAVEHIIPFEFGIVLTMIFWCLCAGISLSLLVFVFSPRRFLGTDGGTPPFFSTIPQPISPAPPSRPEFDAESLPETFDPAACGILEAARAEAARLGHEYIGTEHVLLGLLAKRQGKFSTLLRSLELEPEHVRLEIENWVSPLPTSVAKANLRFTPRASKALCIATREADRQKRTVVRAEDILLGLVVEGGGIAAKVLRRLGIRIAQLRAEMRR